MTIFEALKALEKDETPVGTFVRIAVAIITGFLVVATVMAVLMVMILVGSLPVGHPVRQLLDIISLPIFVGSMTIAFVAVVYAILFPQRVFRGKGEKEK